MTASSPRPRIAFVVATDVTVRAFLSGHLRALSERYDVTVVANTDDLGLLDRLGVAGTVVPIGIERDISLSADLRALAALVRLFRRERFDAVHSVTPKAGLLAMVAARFAGISHRTHTFTGQVWATRAGASRLLLKTLDAVTHRASTFSLVDSPSQRDFLVGEGVLRDRASGVLGPGSISGVDTARYRPDASARADVREAWGIGPEDVLFLQLGRVSREKGPLDLADAFARVRPRVPHARLAFVGPDEHMLGEVRERLGAALPAVHIVDEFTSVPERYIAAADVLCLPSYREGFGSILIEAAATGIPVVASRIYGITDAVIDGQTGLLHTPGDVGEIAAHLERLASDADLRAALGAAGQVRARAEFSEAALTEAMTDYYAERLAPPHA